MMHHRIHATACSKHDSPTNTDACKESSSSSCCISPSAEEHTFKDHNVEELSAKGRVFTPYRYRNRKNDDLSWVLFLLTGILLLLSGMLLGTLLAQRNANGDFFENYDPLNVPLPFNSKYKVPESHEVVGDRSDQYVLFRKEYDEAVSDDAERSLEFVKKQRKYTFDTFPFESHHSDQLMDYDIHNCPENPPVGYPFAWNVMDVLENWPASDVTPRPVLYNGLCIFDYTKDYEKAMTYRNAELPFVIKNDPNIAKTVERWNSPGYMENMIGNTEHRTEYSESDHFLYSVPLPKKHQKEFRKHGKKSDFLRKLKLPEDWKPPTETLRMTYREWLSKANVTEHVGPHDPHYYFRLIGCGLTGADGSCDKGSSEYLYDELPFFQPVENLYIREPAEQKGIHCRFGMNGLIAENHFDAGRNTIAVLGGSRRYLLAHPNQCENMVLYPNGHPSARHSEVDWSNPDLDKFPAFGDAKVNEVVLQAGDAMYLPTHWFHHIISLELNFQCNTRSGNGYEYEEVMSECGFNTPHAKGKRRNRGV